MRVLLVDDHLGLRRAVAMQLRHEPDIEVIGEAGNGQTAVEITRELRPDVVIMDVQMPIMDGVKATRLIHAEFPDITVIGYSMFHTLDQIQEMREAGARDYVQKDSVSASLLSAIRGSVRPERQRISKAP
jgi:DNA-binding NarL/FixJ family response regulator